jgi:hypothetical protein
MAFPTRTLRRRMTMPLARYQDPNDPERCVEVYEVENPAVNPRYAISERRSGWSARQQDYLKSRTKAELLAQQWLKEPPTPIPRSVLEAREKDLKYRYRPEPEGTLTEGGGT